MDQDAEVKGNLTCIRKHESISPLSMYSPPYRGIRSRFRGRAGTQHSFPPAPYIDSNRNNQGFPYGVIYYGKFLGRVHGTAGGGVHCQVCWKHCYCCCYWYYCCCCAFQAGMLLMVGKATGLIRPGGNMEFGKGNLQALSCLGYEHKH